MSFYQKKFEDLKVELKDKVLWLTLNLPEKSNCLSKFMINSLVNVLSYADKDHLVWAIVITGEGKSFCAGGDVKAMASRDGMFAGESNQLRENYTFGIQEIPRMIERMQTPLLAMVNGPAIGAGNDLACMCDFRLASNNAKFGSTFTKIGLVPGDGGTYFLQRIVGYSRALEMILTGKILTSKEAYDWGLLNREPFSESDLRPKVEEFLQQILSNPPIAMALSKKALKMAYHSSNIEEHLDLLAAYQGITQRTHDHFFALSTLKNEHHHQNYSFE